MIRNAFLVLLLAATSASASTDELWTAKCKSCHGASGSADTKQGRKLQIADFRIAEWQAKKSDAEIRKAISDGVPETKMKAYGDKLEPAELDALVAFIRGFKQ